MVNAWGKQPVRWWWVLASVRGRRHVHQTLCAQPPSFPQWGWRNSGAAISYCSFEEI